MSTFMNWLSSPSMGKDPIYQNVASDVQSHVDSSGGEFHILCTETELYHDLSPM